MDERPEGNYELEKTSVFETLNQYFLLFFSFSCILSSVFIQELFVMMQQFRIGIAVAPTVGILLPIFLLTRRFYRGFKHQLRIRRSAPRLTFYVLLSTLAMVVVVDYVYMISQSFMPLTDQYIESMRELKPVGVLSMLITFLGLCVVVPIAEEVVFRGMIQQIFARNMGNTIAIVLAGVFFGAIHFNPQLLISMTLFGVFLGFLFYVTSNLTYTIVAHATLNTVAFYQLTMTASADFQIEPFYIQNVWILVLAVSLVLVLLRQIKKGASTEAPVNSEGDGDRR